MAKLYKKKHIIFPLISLVLLLIFTKFVFAQIETPTPSATPTLSPTPTQTPTASDPQKQQDLQKQISDLQSKISGLKSQQNSLSSQIKIIDSQVSLTELKIANAQEQITNLKVDIEITKNKISSSEGNLEKTSHAFVGRAEAVYKQGSIDPWQVILTSNTLNNFFTRLKYLKIVQLFDKKQIYEAEQAKVNYSNQQQILVDKKKQEEVLNAQLKQYNDQLSKDKKDKQVLLNITQNNEAIFQQKLQAALAEQRAIQQIASGGGNAVEVGPVAEGDIIGYMINGRSVCSSGTHLHFEVHSNGALQNPSTYLANKSVIWDNSPDGSINFTGSWNFPVSDPVRIEQGYGMTYWARTGWYGGGPHTGIDMFSDSSSAVRAVKPGKLFRGGIACAGRQLLFARVDQDNGVQVYYLHIVP